MPSATVHPSDDAMAVPLKPLTLTHLSGPRSVAWPDEWWISIVLTYVLLPLQLPIAVLVVYFSCLSDALSSAAFAVTKCGRIGPLFFIFWQALLAGGLSFFLKGGGSRVSATKMLAGKGGAFFSLLSSPCVFLCKYADVRRIVDGSSGPQRRINKLTPHGRRAEATARFDVTSCPIPECCPARTLIMLGGLEHRHTRAIIRRLFFETPSVTSRLADAVALREVAATQLRARQLAPGDAVASAAQLNSASVGQALARAVGACIWHVFFDVRLAADETDVLETWCGGLNKIALVLPRGVHRLAANTLLRRTLKARRALLELCHAKRAVSAELDAALRAYAHEVQTAPAGDGDGLSGAELARAGGEGECVDEIVTVFHFA